MIIDKIRKKFLNVLVFFDLMKLNKKLDSNNRQEKSIQSKRIKKLMKKAYKIPFYRERFDAVGLSPKDFASSEDLLKFPILTKRDLKQWMEEETKNPKYRYYFVDTTSGSSGTPTKLLYSPKEKAFNMANWIRVLMKIGYNPITGLTASRMSAHSTSASQKNFFQHFGLLRREFINQYESESNVIQQINNIKPDLLYMNKTELMRVAVYAIQNNIMLHHPRFLIPTGEMIDKKSRDILMQVFGDGLIDAFGSAETGSCMTKYPGYDYYRIHEDLFVVNVMSEDSESERYSGKLIVTPLYKTDVPLINYEVGDYAVCIKKDGRKYIESVQGRMNDYILHSNGEKTTFFMIAPIFAHCEGTVQMRCIQKSFDLLIIQAVKDKIINMDTSEIEKSIINQLQSKLKSPMKIEFEWLDAISPDPNGKLRLIVNEISH